MLSYRFECESSWREHPANDTWENIRYLLEQRHGMQGSAGKATAVQCYVVGRRAESAATAAAKCEIQESEFLAPGSRLVLRRRPMPSARSAPHVPLKFRAVVAAPAPLWSAAPVLPAGGTEEQRIQALIDGSRIAPTPVVDRAAQGRHSGGGPAPRGRHASQYRSEPHPGPAMLINYTCHYCGERERHFFRDCPRRSDVDFVPLFRRRIPHGVPRSEFRDARTEQERRCAFVTPEGRTVVWRDAQRHADFLASVRRSVESEARRRAC